MKRQSLYLVHHGILGMKWGERNGPPYPLNSSDHSPSEKKAGWRKSLRLGSKTKIRRSSLEDDYHKSQQNYEKELLPISDLKFTPQQREQFKKVVIGTAAVIGVGAAIYFGYKYASINKIADLSRSGTLTKEVANSVMLQTLADGDQILKQGDVLHRMSAYADIDYTKATKPLYVSFKPTDVAIYKLVLKDWSGTGKRYDVTFKALKDLRIPSKQKAREIFEELWRSDPKYRQTLEKTVTDAYIKLGMNPVMARQKVLLDLSNDPFSVAIYSIVKGKEDTTTYLSKVRDAGYDAITDYFDAGSFTDHPLIILDPAQTIQKTGETFVDRRDKLKTLEDLRDMGVDALSWYSTSYSIEGLMDMVRIGML